MKTIKFRAWDKVKENMFKPQAITFDSQSLAPFALRVPGRSWEPITKFELTQYTGLCDDIGTDVYEGDFVKISSILYKVVWNQTVAGFELQDLDTSAKRNINEVTQGVVVGNRFQNADLEKVG